MSTEEIIRDSTEENFTGLFDEYMSRNIDDPLLEEKDKSIRMKHDVKMKLSVWKDLMETIASESKDEIENTVVELECILLSIEVANRLD